MLPSTWPLVRDTRRDAHESGPSDILRTVIGAVWRARLAGTLVLCAYDEAIGRWAAYETFALLCEPHFERHTLTLPDSSNHKPTVRCMLMRLRDKKEPAPWHAQFVQAVTGGRS